LGTHAVKAVLERSGLGADQIDQVIFGHARQAGCGPNPARQVLHASGIPVEREAFTVNQACLSGMKAILLAVEAVRAGEAKAILAGGMESMSNTPYLLPKGRWGQAFGHQEVVDAMYRDGFLDPLSKQLMGETAENLVGRYKISRDEQDAFAAKSQNRCEQAMAQGKFRAEIAPVDFGNGKTLAADEHPRQGVAAQSLAKLKPVFSKDGTVTPGNSCGITDGGAALLVTDEKTAKGFADGAERCLARVVDFTVVGVDPAVMGIGPVPAVKKLLARTGMKLSDIDLIELNEAFAAQVLACDRELHFDPEKLNVNGGAIALGHPIGATGARIVVTLLHELYRRKARYGLATLCVSGGLGGALLVERAK
jgi:acetyl-CoA C-acetyltransferase